MPEGLDDAREAFAQEIAPQAPPRPRDNAGRFVAAPGPPEPMFEPRPLEGDAFGDTSDGGPDPRLLAHERRVADGWSEEGNEAAGRRGRDGRPRDLDGGLRQTQPGDGVGVRRDGRPQPAEGAGPAGQDDRHESAEDEQGERKRPPADAADKDAEEPDGGPEEGGEGRDAEGQSDEDPNAPRYKVQVDGQEKEVTLNEALRGYVAQETFNQRMGQMAEVARAIDARGQEATQSRDAYIALCRRQEEEFRALIPAEPQNWDELYRANPSQAHLLEKNYRAVYGTLGEIQRRRAAAEAEAYADHARRTAEYSRTEFQKFCQRNKLTDQSKIDSAVSNMRRTALSHGFSEDEIGSTYDERMLSVLNKAAKYDAMMASKPPVAQPDRRALSPGSAPRVGDATGRRMNDAQRRLAASGRIDDAALVMAQLIR